MKNKFQIGDLVTHLTWTVCLPVGIFCSCGIILNIEPTTKTSIVKWFWPDYWKDRIVQIEDIELLE